jgi:hypothetical protein
VNEYKRDTFSPINGRPQESWKTDAGGPKICLRKF